MSNTQQQQHSAPACQTVTYTTHPTHVGVEAHFCANHQRVTIGQVTEKRAGHVGVEERRAVGGCHGHAGRGLAGVAREEPRSGRVNVRQEEMMRDMARSAVKVTDDEGGQTHAEALASVFAHLEHAFMRLAAGEINQYERERIKAMSTVAGVLIKLAHAGEFEARLRALEERAKDAKDA